MLRLLLVIAVIAACWYFHRLSRRLSPAERRRVVMRAIVIGAVVGLAALAATGRMHWAAPLLAALIPLLRGMFALALPLLIRLFGERVGRGKSQRSHTGGEAPPRSSGGIARSEALATLGLTEPASRDEIIQAHRRLMQRMHPDRGGSDYLAARINQAKDVLLG